MSDGISKVWAVSSGLKNILVSFQGLDQCTIWGNEINLNGHLPDCVRGAGKARVIRADGCFYAIEHTFMDVWSLDVGLCHAVHGIAHGPIVVASRNDEIYFEQLAIFISSVVVDERAARSFKNTYAVACVILAGIENIGAENIGVFA